MSALMHDVARAALPVAIGLLICAAWARAVVWAQIDHGQAQRIAQQYLEPLSTWCLVAVAVHTLALGAAGDADVLSLALPLVLGAAAVVLRATGEPSGPPAVAREERPPAPPPPATAPVPARAPDGSLWAEAADDETTRRAGLWSRA